MKYSLINNVVHIVNPFNKYPYPVLYFCGLLYDTTLKLNLEEIEKLMKTNTRYCRKCFRNANFYADKLKDIDKAIRFGNKIIYSGGIENGKAKIEPND